MGFGYLTSAPENERDFLVQFRDDDKGENIQSNPLHSKLAVTNAQTLNPLPVWYRLDGKVTVSATVTNFNTAAITVYLALRGYKRVEPATA